MDGQPANFQRARDFLRVGLIAALLALAALPFVAAAFFARAMLAPPMPNTRLVSFRGLDGDGTCADHPAVHGGRILMCTGHMVTSSHFAIIDHDPAAVAWCVSKVNTWFFGGPKLTQLGPLRVGLFPPVPRDWSWCHELLPIQHGVYVELMLEH